MKRGSKKVAGLKKKEASAPTKLPGAADDKDGYVDVGAEEENAEVFGFGSSLE